MPINRSQRYRRVTDLFVTGRAVPMPDGSYLWVQAINDYERDEAINDAQIARARLVLALKDDGRERLKIQGRLAEIGREALIAELAKSKTQNRSASFIDELRSDPEWKERIEIVLSTDWDQEAKPPSEAETLYLAKVNEEVLNELARRETDESDFQTRRLERLTDDDLIEEWIDEWLDNRGSERATAEFRLTEMWYSARFCEASAGERDDDLDHSRCDGHRERVFESKNDARSCPGGLQKLLREAIDAINVAGTDPKGSASPQASSATSEEPNAGEESTPSTSIAIPETPPGTSPQPLATA